jgi:hypothetical protein
MFDLVDKLSVSKINMYFIILIIFKHPTRMAFRFRPAFLSEFWPPHFIRHLQVVSLP